MKKLFTILLILTGLTAFAKSPVDSVAAELLYARQILNVNNAHYNPQQAFSIFTKYAGQGNADAMNALGNLYNSGTGTALDENAALHWYSNAANAGYGKAWYNLALMYKNGVSVPQDNAKAFDCYSKGALLNDGMCLYGQGYMLYKGYGCAQNYELAVAAFKKGAAVNDGAAWYMLGLCYRNGYGIAVNVDSARYWLTKAAGRNDARAIQELAASNAENQDLQNVPNLQPAASFQAQPVDLKTGFKSVAHHITTDDLDGDYSGYVIKFDWSGKHIISQADLKLHLNHKDKDLTGKWTEYGQEEIPLSGTLTDTAVIFYNTALNQTDHYHTTTPLDVEFKQSKLNMVKSGDTVYLSGNLALYSPQFKETRQPEFIMLIRTGTGVGFADNADVHTDSLHFVAYPNPFTSSLRLRFTLKTPATVSIMVSNILNGHIVYQSSPVDLGAGDHTTPVNFDGQAGNYIVTLLYGNKLKSAIVFKQ